MFHGTRPAFHDIHLLFRSTRLAFLGCGFVFHGIDCFLGKMAFEKNGSGVLFGHDDFGK